MKTKWRLIKRINAAGAMQMAIDEAILSSRIQGKCANTLRFFTWNPPCITIGFFQSMDREVNFEKAKMLGVDAIRRYTGGGAVLHDLELTYSIALRENDVPSDILKSYEKICGALILGMEKLGVDAKFSPINDIVVNGKKVSGNAQTRQEGVILQHGTVLVDVDVKKMFSLLNVSDEKIKDKMIKSAEERVTSLNHELKRKITEDELEKALIIGFEIAFDVIFEEGELTKEELELAQKLYEEKYSADKWNFMR